MPMLKRKRFLPKLHHWHYCNLAEKLLAIIVVKFLDHPVSPGFWRGDQNNPDASICIFTMTILIMDSWVFVSKRGRPIVFRLRSMGVNGYVGYSIRNKGLQQKLGYLSWAKGMTGKQLFSRVSRHLRLLRDHGLIRKQPKQRKYLLTDKGRQLTTALNALIGASTEQLFKMSA